jgi:transposase
MTYQELRQIDAIAARQKVLDACKHQHPTEVARLLRMSRTTIYKIISRFRQKGAAGLNDLSRRPKHPHGQTDPALEHIVVQERHRTGFGPRRMHRHLQSTAGITIPPSTLRNIFRRNGLTHKGSAQSMSDLPGNGQNGAAAANGLNGSHIAEAI